MTVLLSDGDVVFQPRKAERSGLTETVESRVLIFTHKEKELANVVARYPAQHYVMMDDKIRILTAMKKIWGRRPTTVFVRQGTLRARRQGGRQVSGGGHFHRAHRRPAQLQAPGIVAALWKSDMSETNDGVAFGAPGIEPRWTSSAKEGFGTAYHTACRLWFTLSHGIINEIYYPFVDQPNTRDFQYLITDGETRFVMKKNSISTTPSNIRTKARSFTNGRTANATAATASSSIF